MNRRDFLTGGAAVTGGYLLQKWLRQDSLRPPSEGDGNPLDQSPTATEEPSTPSQFVLDFYNEKIVVNTDELRDLTHHFSEYGYDSARIRVLKGSLSPELQRDFKIVVATVDSDDFTHVLGQGESLRYQNINSDIDVQIDITLPSEYEGIVRHIAVAIPGDKTLETTGDSEGEKLAETNRFQTRQGLVQRILDKPLEDIETSTYSRTSFEGMYYMTFQGWTRSTNWENSMVLFKSGYEFAVTEPRTRRIPEYVEHALTEGYAATLATILDENARDLSFRSKRERTEFVIDFIQNLPYVPDDVSKGYNDYSKFVAETLIEGGGDCEDTAILTAAVLSSPPFEYDVVLIYLPGHVAVGIYGTDLPGTYYQYNGRRYYYLETTGRGWDVGELPEEYRDKKARIIPV